MLANLTNPDNPQIKIPAISLWGLARYCLTHTLASEYRLGQPNWMNYWGQFSQKNLWLRVEINGEFVGKEWQYKAILIPAKFQS